MSKKEEDFFCIASDDETSQNEDEELYIHFSKDAAHDLSIRVTTVLINVTTAKRYIMLEVNDMLRIIPERLLQKHGLADLRKNDKTTQIDIVQHYEIFNKYYKGGVTKQLRDTRRKKKRRFVKIQALTYTIVYPIFYANGKTMRLTLETSSH